MSAELSLGVVTQDFAEPPANVDRLIIHQFDPARPSPGGIDTCIRGITRYFPSADKVAVIGVDTGAGPAGRKLGRWERYTTADRVFWFLPVVALDPADQARRIPHAVRVIAGLLRHRGRLPKTRLVQVHRMDSAFVLRRIIRKPQLYLIHTQENGLTGKTSDSFWRFTGQAHQKLERSVVKNAKSIVVFNEDYSAQVRQWNERAVFSPTWFDPALIVGDNPDRDDFKVVWVGRLEVPKDPALAIQAFAHLLTSSPELPWTLDVLGSGTMLEEVEQIVSNLPGEVRERINLRGRVAPEQVAQTMSLAGVFLMTSHPGYEGYARVLVESMASGLVPVVTEGSDTGGLVVNGETGYVIADRSASGLADAIAKTPQIDRAVVKAAVKSLDAPSLIGRIFDLDRVQTSQKEYA